MASIEQKGHDIGIKANNTDEAEYIQIMKCPSCPLRKRCSEMSRKGAAIIKNIDLDEVKRDASCV